jgi:hypothetical protein
MADGSDSSPYQVVCEGGADLTFITKLLQARWGVHDFGVRCTKTGKDNRCAGTSGLTETLQALDAIRATKAGAARGIAIVFDSDDDATSSFDNIVKSIREAKLKYPLPDRPLEVKAGNPSIAVALIPWIDRKGHLDELIFEALNDSHRDLLQPIEDFRMATSHRTGSWSFGAQSKMKLRCMLAASHQRDPGIALNYWLQSSGCPVDLWHPCFDQLMAFFEDFRNKA